LHFALVTFLVHHQMEMMEMMRKSF